MRRKIQAGAGVENLRLRCPYFYDVALALHATDGAPSVADLVMSTFRSRYQVGRKLLAAGACCHAGSIAATCHGMLCAIARHCWEVSELLRSCMWHLRMQCRPDLLTSAKALTQSFCQPLD